MHWIAVKKCLVTALATWYWGPTSFPMHNWLHLIALASILYFFLPTFSPTQKLDLLQTFSSEILWRTFSFPFKLPEKRPQKIDGLKAIAYQMTACMHIGYAICNTSVFLLCICCNRLPFWVYCVWKKGSKYHKSSLHMNSFCIQINVLIKK